MQCHFNYTHTHTHEALERKCLQTPETTTAKERCGSGFKFRSIGRRGIDFSVSFSGSKPDPFVHDFLGEKRVPGLKVTH